MWVRKLTFCKHSPWLSCFPNLTQGSEGWMSLWAKAEVKAPSAGQDITISFVWAKNNNQSHQNWHSITNIMSPLNQNQAENTLCHLNHWLIYPVQGSNEIVSQSVAVRALTWRGCWLDVDRSWFNQGQHRGLQGLDDDCLGRQGSWCVSQGHSCNEWFWLDGNLWANLNRPLDWLGLFGWWVCFKEQKRKEWGKKSEFR